jgi:hypothetical protein
VTILSRGVAIAAAAAAVVGIVAVGGVAFALGDDHESRVAGPQADHAVAAAVAGGGGGAATGVERERTGTAAGWGVEVVTRDGRHVEVLVDSGYRVVAVDRDADDDDPAGDD